MSYRPENNEYVTSDLSEFGYRELDEVKELLEAYSSNRSSLFESYFDDEGIYPMFNKYSGCVFLTNSDYQTAMINGDGELDIHFFTPYHGHEGFADELREQIDEDWHEDDIEFLKGYDILDDDDVYRWQKAGSIDIQVFKDKLVNSEFEFDEDDLEEMYELDFIDDEELKSLRSTLENDIETPSIFEAEKNNVASDIPVR